jgi:hypothetical protein
VPAENFPYYEDYPMHDSHWDLWETFGSIYLFKIEKNIKYAV